MLFVEDTWKWLMIIKKKTSNSLYFANTPPEFSNLPGLQEYLHPWRQSFNIWLYKWNLLQALLTFLSSFGCTKSKKCTHNKQQPRGYIRICFPLTSIKLQFPKQLLFHMSAAYGLCLQLITTSWESAASDE